MSERDIQRNALPTRHRPLMAWLAAALLFVFGIRMLTTVDR